jgi:CHAT domain-containing protein/tetratricopeptide (TPR) repeat protein
MMPNCPGKHRSDPSPDPQAISAALDAFLNTETWDDTFVVLQRNQRLLLSQSALDMLRYGIGLARQRGDASAVSLLEQHLRLLEDASSVGIDAARMRFQARTAREREGQAARNTATPSSRLPVQIPADLVPLIQEIRALRQAQQMTRCIALIDVALSQVDPRDNPRLWAWLRASRGVNCFQNTEGNERQNIEQAIADYTAALAVYASEKLVYDLAKTYVNRGTAYSDRIEGDKRQNLERAISDYNAALEVFTPETQPKEWAMAISSRGNAYWQRIDGARQQNLEQALADYDAALTVFSRQTAPYDWAKNRLNRSKVYQERIDGERRQNMEQAIADGEAALSVFTRESFPLEWARTRMCLGNAYQDHVQGEWRQNLEVAIACFDEALTVFTRDANPYDWALTLLNRGHAFSRRISGNHEQNLEQAMADYTAALSVLTYESYPREWAFTLMNRGNAYKELTQGDLQHHLKLVLADYSASLSVFTPSTDPLHWARILANRGTIYQHLSEGDREQNLERALADFNAALTALSFGSAPQDWIAALKNRSNAYQLRLAGDKEQNLELALADIQEILKVITRDSLPYDWAGAMMKLANIYQRRLRGDRKQNLEQALVSYTAALTVYTRESMPQEYRMAQFNRSSALASLERWEEAHAAMAEVRAVQRDALADAMSEESRTQFIAQHSEHDMYLRDVEAMLHLERPPLDEIAIALEEGRAQALRAALDLNSLDLSNIADPETRARAKTFLEARDSWRSAQREMLSPLPSDPVQSVHIRALRSQSLQNSYNAFLQARDAIRQHDDPDFLSPLPTLERIAAALIAPDEALVYLVAGYERGLASIVTRDEHGIPNIQSLMLPDFSEAAVEQLMITTSVHIGGMEDTSSEVPLVDGGFMLGQMHMTFVLSIWGASLREALLKLPPTSGLAVAALRLVESWMEDPLYHSLLGTPFSDLTEEQTVVLDSALADSLLRVELERSLRALRDLGLHAVAQYLHRRGIHRVALVPYGSLALFPLTAVLVTVDGRQQYLGDLFELTIVPSARSLEIAKQRAANMDPRQRPAIVAVGDPAPLPAGVCQLKFAEAEASALARIAHEYAKAMKNAVDRGSAGLNNIQCFTRTSAEKDRVIRALEKAWFADIAVHGQYRQEDPRQSALLLANGETITLAECLNGAIDLIGLRLFVLSACETSVIEVFRTPNEVLGMATGFLQVGAAGVIASLWAVDDRATFLLMSRFAQLYLDPQRGRSPARALAEAQRWLREEATNRVLATFDPLQKIASVATGEKGEPAGTIADAVHQPLASARRSLRYGYSAALTQVHSQASQRATEAPTALPYADPIYWAAFVVTGC